MSALDLSTQAQVLNLLADLRDQRGLAFMFIAHDLGVVRFLAQRTVVLYRGQIMETGPVEAVNSRPRHPYTVALTAAAPVPRPAEQAARRAAREALGVGTAGAAQPAATGCPFVPRCPLATDVCVAERPPLRLVDGTLTACHHAERVPRPVTAPVRRGPPRACARSAAPGPTLDALVGKLDLETKVRLLSGAGAWTTEAVPEIGLRALTVSDGPVGVRGGTDTELDPSAALPVGLGAWPRPGTRTCCGGSAGCWPARPCARASTSSSARRSTCTAPRWAAGTSSASPRTRC